MQNRTIDFGITQQKLSTWLFEREHIFPERLLAINDFASFAANRGIAIIGSSISGHAQLLWRLGLLRADLIRTDEPVNYPGLMHVGADIAWSYYADARPLDRRPQGWAGVGRDAPEMSKALQPLFHPFRLFDLIHLERIFDLSISHIQMLLNDRGYAALLPQIIESLNRWSSSDEFYVSLEYWRGITTLAIATEPCVQEQVRGSYTGTGHVNWDQYFQAIDAHWADIEPRYKTIGINALHQICGDVICESQRKDENRHVQTFLRLSGPRVWSKLESNLGCAMWLRIMSETIRRASEKALAVEFREEDEIGFGYTYPGVKENMYGSQRLLDGDQAAAADFVRQAFVDYRLPSRFYVEGSTEAAAARAFFGDALSYGVDVVNLAGQVRQKGKLAFRDSLVADEETSVYSFVMIDADRQDFVDVLQEAAGADAFCGAFWLSKPDFEFQNFSLAELQEIAWQMAMGVSTSGKPPPEDLRRAIERETSGAAAGKAFEAGAARAFKKYGMRFSKGSAWGEALGRYAAERPNGPDGKTRMCVEAFTQIARVRRVPFQRTRRDMQVDAKTGKLEPRSP